jgi:hypothetical protein
LFLLAYSPIWGVAQITVFDVFEPTRWLRPELHGQSLLTDSVFTGNYTRLDSSHTEVKEALNFVSRQRHGTLFVVYRRAHSMEDTTHLRLGGIQIFEDSVQVGSRYISARKIGNRTIILRINYQMNSRFKNNRVTYDIPDSTDVAEILYYDRKLNQNKAQAIETYLALKYSINFSSNTNTNKRSLKGANGQIVWSFPNNSEFSDQVMALGRDDKVDWFQSLTTTTDSDSVIAGFSPFFGVRSYMPNAPINQGAWILVNKRNLDSTVWNPTQGCDSIVHSEFFFKLHLRNWLGTNPSQLYLYTKEDVTENNRYIVFLAQRDTSFVLSHVRVQDWSRIEVPLDPWLPVAELYVGRYPNPDSCIVSPKVGLKNCTELLVTNVREQRFSLRLKKVSSNEAESWHMIENEDQPIALEANSVYHMQLYSSRGNLLNEELVNTENCTLSSDNLRDGWINKPAEESNNTNQDAWATKEGLDIRVYPNPTRPEQRITIEIRGQKDKMVEMILTDSKGSRVKDRKWIASSEVEKWTIQLSNKATYVLLVRTDQASATEQIIIQ